MQHIEITSFEELEDGGAKISFDADIETRDFLVGEGFKLVITCAIMNIDLTEVFPALEQYKNSKQESKA